MWQSAGFSHASDAFSLLEIVFGLGVGAAWEGRAGCMTPTDCGFIEPAIFPHHINFVLESKNLAD